MRHVALTTALALVLAAPAAGWLGPEQKRGDLDGDGVPETVKAVQLHVPEVTDPAFDRTALEVDAACAGKAAATRIAGPQNNLSRLRLLNADGRKGREVFVELRSGLAGRAGEASLVAWRKSARHPCGRPRRLFAYETDHHTRTPRGGNGDMSGFGARLFRRRRSRTVDVALTEYFTRKGEPLCCGSIRKVTSWRYSARRDRYVRYRTSVRYGKRR